MRKLIVGGLAVIGALAILAVLVGGVVAVLARVGAKRVPARTLLEVDLERAIVEIAPDDPLSRLFDEPVLAVRDLVDALERAGGDDRVAGLVARVGAAPAGMAAVQEVRDAVLAFRESGKPAVAWAETFGEFGPGNVAYYLATAFDEVHLQPSGDVGLTGFQYEAPFIRGTLEKLGIEPRIGQRHEYKNAADFYTERRFTDAHREALQRIFDSRFDQVIRGIAEGRNLTPDAVRELADRGPFLGEEALEAGLVDHLSYRDEVYAGIRESLGVEPHLLYLSKYLRRAGRPHQSGETIALVYGVGTVVRGGGGYDSFSGESYLGSDTVAGAIRDAVEDDRVRAIVLRVDSPGGSYVGSDTVLRETIRAREAGKPVIVSMGNLAASGGYFVSMAADRIVAQPATITGSIGVFGGKLLTRGFWSKLGLSWDEVHTSRNAALWSSLEDYDAAERARFEASLDRIYDDFTAQVAELRGIELDRVHEIARGRIWTGEDARELGLVDELGGLPVALRLAREAAGLAPDASIRVRVLPRPRSMWDRLFGEGPDSSEGGTAASLRTLAELRRLVRASAVLRRVAVDPDLLLLPGAERLELP